MVRPSLIRSMTPMWLCQHLMRRTSSARGRPSTDAAASAHIRGLCLHHLPWSSAKVVVIQSERHRLQRTRSAARKIGGQDLSCRSVSRGRFVRQACPVVHRDIEARRCAGNRVAVHIDHHHVCADEVRCSVERVVLHRRWRDANGNPCALQIGGRERRSARNGPGVAQRDIGRNIRREGLPAADDGELDGAIWPRCLAIYLNRSVSAEHSGVRNVSFFESMPDGER